MIMERKKKNDYMLSAEEVKSWKWDVLASSRGN